MIPQNFPALLTAAKKIGVSPRALWLVIRHESNGDPQAKNPLSSARGLIQFVDSTARGMGYQSSSDLVRQHPTADSQLLGPVIRYYQQFRGITDKTLPLATFYPLYMRQPLDTAFPAHVTRANPGIHTPRDYIRRVYGSADFGGVSPKMAGALAALAAAVSIFFSQLGGINEPGAVGGGSPENISSIYTNSTGRENHRCGCGCGAQNPAQ